MKEFGLKRQRSSVIGSLGIFLQLFLLIECAATRRITKKDSQLDLQIYPPVQLLELENHVLVDNGLFNVTFSVPGGMVTGIQYNGIDNLLEKTDKQNNRGYWDVVWNKADKEGNIYDKLEGTNFEVILQDENQVELSFTRTWRTLNASMLSINIDKRCSVYNSPRE